jgi:hypothetical protein
MNSYLKKIISLVLILSISLTISIPAFAAKNNQVPALNSITRSISSGGKFTINFKSQLTSGGFKVKSSSSTITIKATTSGSDKYYKVYLEGDNGYSDVATYYADGSYQAYTFDGLDTNEIYHMTFIAGGGAYIKGNGTISNYKCSA